MALGSLTGPGGRPLCLDSKLRVGQRGVGTASRWAEMKQSFWELVCFWDRGAVRASGLAGGTPSPGQPGGEGNLRESPRLAASFSCSDPPKEPRGESVPPPSAQQAPAHSGLLPDPQETHRLYRVKLEELTKLQNSCTSSIARQKKQLQELALVLKKLGPSPPPHDSPSLQ